MYLTRFELNRARRGAQKLLGSPHAMHAAVQSAFPPKEGSSSRARVLWRVDAGEFHTRLYIVSPERPDLTHVVEQAGWPTSAGWDTRAYGSFLETLQEGQRWGFRLTANPTRAIPQGPGQRGKRVAHVTADQQLKWLLDRAQSVGLDLGTADHPSFQLTARSIQRFRRETGRVTLSVVEFTGETRVTDAEKLRQALRLGIGPAKGYGCGLLTLAPVADSSSPEGPR